MMKQTVLEIKNLRVVYHTDRGDVQAVRGISYQVKQGETVALVGESGCGKSASVKPIMGQPEANQSVSADAINFTYQTAAGQKTINLLKTKSKVLQNQIKGKEIAMVFQDPMTSLDPTMRIKQQIAEAVKAANPRLERTEINKRVLDLITTVGIHNAKVVQNQYPHQLSGGMRQRIVIAIALAGDPRLLICDEPTTGLDVTIQARILNLIKEIQRNRQLSVIFITHNLGVVANIANYVNVMYAGKIVETGTSKDIFFDPRHPYTWGLLESVPDINEDVSVLPTISGTIPDLTQPIVGDAFAPRNPYALNVDFKQEPPMFKINDHHYAATWLLDSRAPKVAVPAILQKRIRKMKEADLND
ncbi:ABC transporter ATP-binding protein [Lactobacillus sp. ESL0684]|uniref:ABC transporter ATP-binding protein n=1 Tax=unclassified Lactobacillus TaxID=2620435 RepID=UPI0023F7E558|nr:MULTISPECIES: ABC transporter ATP-binding protein [unclassified Lactobacillus]WEV40266.1 ABC transporter ATP-binding protein [Lactobacillus sp. ESL0681]WEV43212.1 ABC transporter ATP-binding protein [Lactobacillus sp. ESL0684]